MLINQLFFKQIKYHFKFLPSITVLPCGPRAESVRHLWGGYTICSSPSLPRAPVVGELCPGFGALHGRYASKSQLALGYSVWLLLGWPLTPWESLEQWPCSACLPSHSLLTTILHPSILSVYAPVPRWRSSNKASSGMWISDFAQEPGHLLKLMFYPRVQKDWFSSYFLQHPCSLLEQQAA